MNGHCPRCNADDWSGYVDWLSTTNEWEYYCKRCDIRFNAEGKVKPERGTQSDGRAT